MEIYELIEIYECPLLGEEDQMFCAQIQMSNGNLRTHSWFIFVCTEIEMDIIAYIISSYNFQVSVPVPW